MIPRPIEIVLQPEGAYDGEGVEVSGCLLIVKVRQGVRPGGGGFARRGGGGRRRYEFG